MEILERRMVLSAVVNWGTDNGTPGIFVRDNFDATPSSVSFGSVADGNGVLCPYVFANGGNWSGASFSPSITMADIGFIDVVGGPLNDTLNLSGISILDFYPNLTGEIYVGGSDGNDSITCSADFGTDAEGGDGDDTVSGGGGDDDISGNLGNDSLTGGGGADVICGDGGLDDQDPTESLPGDGNDTINGGSGCDELYGNGGNDQIDLGTEGAQEPPEFADGGSGNDTLSSVNTNATLNGGSGNDTLWAGGDQFDNGGAPLISNWLNGGDGDDEIHGSANSDSITGGNGYDRIEGCLEDADPEGGDIIDGGAQSDQIYGSPLSDQISGGSGDDAINGRGGDNPNNLSGGSGSNWVDLQHDWNATPEGLLPKVTNVGAVGNTTRPAPIVLQATVQNMGSDIAEVFFYRDADGDKEFDPNVDTELGSTNVVIQPGANAIYQLTIPNQPGSQKLEVGDNTIFAFATCAWGDGLAGNAGKGTVTVKQVKVGVSVAPATINEQDGGTAVVTVTRDGPTDYPLSVSFLESGDAQDGVNYTVSALGVNFAVGAATATLTLTALDDHAGMEPDMTAELDIYAPYGSDDDYYADPANPSAVVTINENAESFTVTASSSSMVMGSSVDFTITRLGDSTGPANVALSIFTSGWDSSDYSPSAWGAAFADGETTKTITVATSYPGWWDMGSIDVGIEWTDGGNIGDPAGAHVDVTDPNSLLLAASPVVGVATSVQLAQLQHLLPYAALEWIEAGIDPKRVSAALASAQLDVTDLRGRLIGYTSGNTILIDPTAGSYGWFVDRSPADSSEFSVAVAPTERRAAAGSDAFGRIDLLTALTHEFGHLLGIADVSSDARPFDIMDSTIDPSTRRYPVLNDQDVVQSLSGPTDAVFHQVGKTSSDAPSTVNFLPWSQRPSAFDGQIADVAQKIAKSSRGARLFP